MTQGKGVEINSVDHSCGCHKSWREMQCGWVCEEKKAAAAVLQQSSC